MAFVTVEVDAADVLDDLSDQELRDELDKRSAKAKGVPNPEHAADRRARLLDEIYQHFRNRCPCEALRQFIGDETGKIL